MFGLADGKYWLNTVRTFRNMQNDRAGHHASIALLTNVMEITVEVLGKNHYGNNPWIKQRMDLRKFTRSKCRRRLQRMGHRDIYTITHR